MKRYVYPVIDRVVIPGTRQALPARGASVEWSTYWQRALDAGDITDTDPAPPKATPKRGKSE